MMEEKADAGSGLNPTDPTMDAQKVHAGWQQDIAAIAGSLVHEIKNPLSTLHINTQLLLEDWKDEGGVKQKRTVKRLNLMNEELKRLEGIINSFLSFTQPQDLTLTAGSINALLDGMIELVAEASELKGIQVRASLDPAVPPVPFDDALLRQAFLNLIKNAQEAMPEGGELIIKSHVDGPWVAVDIIDTGCGISPQRLDKVFDLYFSTKDEGSGLGLARSRRIIREHGGAIDVKSEVNKGTQFTVRLPLKSGRQ